jgi:quercetin 2,3-dioxygenase
MFPLLNPTAPNPLELFQVWLNLPRRSKMAPPYFTMFWSEDIPRQAVTDSDGLITEVTYIAGQPGTTAVVPLRLPPPDSWASDPTADLAIWSIKLSAGARWTLAPAVTSEAHRTLYFYKGADLVLDRQRISVSSALEINSRLPLDLVNGAMPSELLLLQGRPIGEPVVQRGPFVMNTDQELRQAYSDYQRTHFGGWPWPDEAPVHAAQEGRFARHADGQLETPPEA